MWLIDSDLIILKVALAAALSDGQSLLPKDIIILKLVRVLSINWFLNSLSRLVWKILVVVMSCI